MTWPLLFVRATVSITDPSTQGPASAERLRNYYPDRFPTFWKQFETAVTGGAVVTEEVKREHAAKIPNVCQHFDVPCLNMEGFLVQNGWRF